jgi:hypothetical protein
MRRVTHVMPVKCASNVQDGAIFEGVEPEEATSSPQHPSWIRPHWVERSTGPQETGLVWGGGLGGGVLGKQGWRSPSFVY